MDSSKKKTRVKTARKVFLKVSHRKQPLAKDRITLVSLSGKASRHPLFRVSHRNLGKERKTKFVQKFWRVIDLRKLLETRPPGEQRITIRDATLPGEVAGRTLRVANLHAERLYGCKLEKGVFALIQSDRWRAVRHLKNWPPEEEEEDFSEDLSVCFGVLSAIA